MKNVDYIACFFYHCLFLFGWLVHDLFLYLWFIYDLRDELMAGGSATVFALRSWRPLHYSACVTFVVLWMLVVVLGRPLSFGVIFGFGGGDVTLRSCGCAWDARVEYSTAVLLFSVMVFWAIIRNWESTCADALPCSQSRAWARGPRFFPTFLQIIQVLICWICCP